MRVKAGFKQRVEHIAAAEKETLGSLLEAMLAAYESGAATPERGVPAAEARAGRTRPCASGLLTGVRGRRQGRGRAELSVSGLLEDLLASEIARLDPHGGKFGVEVKT